MQDMNVQASHIFQILKGFMSTAVPMNIVKSFTNSGISIRREGRQVFCHVTAEPVHRYPAEEVMNAFGLEAAELPRSNRPTLNLEVLPSIVGLCGLENRKNRANTLKEGASEIF
jgi:hypothetical protein